MLSQNVFNEVFFTLKELWTGTTISVLSWYNKTLILLIV